MQRTSLTLRVKKKKQLKIRKFRRRINPYYALFLKKRKLMRLRKKRTLIKKSYRGPKPRPYFKYKHHKWKYNFNRKTRYLKEKNNWYGYLVIFKKYINYRYALNPSLINFLRATLVVNSHKLVAFVRKLESRLAHILWRSGCVMNMQEALWLVKNKYVSVNYRIIFNTRYFVRANDWITILYLKIKNEKYRLFRFITTYRVFLKSLYLWQKGYPFSYKKYSENNIIFSFLQVSFFRYQILVLNISRYMYGANYYWLYNYLLYRY